MRIRVGTSGYSYKAWKGSFYPEKLAEKRFLEHYATQLETVEINYTFRRFPRTHVVEGWAAKVPDGFQFSLKAPQRITHWSRLNECGETVTAFAERAVRLEDHMGAVLFQLPPNFKKDVPRLRTFLADVPAEIRAAFEFRNDSWFDDGTYDLLREHGAALVVSDKDGDNPPPVVATADRGYLRLRREEYDAAALADWAHRIQDQPWQEVLVYFKHEDAGTGPRLAREFRALF